MSELHRVVDALAQGTRRAVALHDRQGRILAYSAHEGPIDEVRRNSILARRARGPAFEWSRSLGVERATGPMRVPANPDFAMDARICCPVRFDGRLLGLLWLVDPDESVPEDAMPTIQAAADAAALAIHHEHLMEEVERGREREILRDLLSEQKDLRDHAVEELLGINLLSPAEAVVALVVRPVRDRAGMVRQDRTVRAAIERALGDVRRTAPPRHAAQLVRPDHGLLLLSMRARDARKGGSIEQVGEQLHQAMEKALGDDRAWKVVVGIGDAQRDLGDAYLSYNHARQAAEVCGLVESFGPVAAWWELGVYQTLLDLPLSTLTESSLHQGLVRLLHARGSDIWLRTLECYLDLGCDARATARTLHIQRGSLYYRLNRIETLAEVDLHNGDNRLALHLGIKLARLAGFLPPTRGSAKPKLVSADAPKGNSLPPKPAPDKRAKTVKRGPAQPPARKRTRSAS